jgi:competence protein ComEC
MHAARSLGRCGSRQRGSAQRRLSALRPLGWRWRLPLAAAGLIVGQAAASSGSAWARDVVLLAALLAPAMKVQHRAAGSALLIGGLAGLLGLGQGALARVARLNDESLVAAGAHVRLQGTVLAARRSTGRGAGYVRLDLGAVRRLDGGPGGAEAGHGSTLPGRLRLSIWRASGSFEVGERVAFVARTRAVRGFCNAGGDALAAMLLRQGIVATASLGDDRQVERIAPATGQGLIELLGRARKAIGCAIGAAVPGPDGAVLRALVIGDQDDIPPALRLVYGRTGTTHVLSVSGLHIAVVALCGFRLAHALLVRVPGLAGRLLVARGAAIFALLPALVYSLLAGAAVATIRSLIMAALYFGATAVVRRAAIEPALAASALLICLFDPGAFGDMSFQLSFASVAAIVLGIARLDRSRVGERLRRLTEGRGVVASTLRWLAGGLAVSVVAALGTAPLTAHHFGSLSLVGVVANLVVVPLVGAAAVVVGLAGAVVLALSDRIAAACFISAGLCIQVANRCASWLSEVPGAAIAVPPPSAFETGLCLALLATRVLPSARPRRVVTCGVLLMLALDSAGWLWQRAFAARLLVHFLDVGQGDAAIVELAAGGPTLVVDGGGLGTFDPGERIVARRLWADKVWRLDALAMSHPQYDHYAGLTALAERFAPRAFWSTGGKSASRAFAALDAALDQAGAARFTLRRGDEPLHAGRSGQGLVLHPAASAPDLTVNDASLVLAIQYGASRVIFTGDVEAAGEREMLATSQPVAATILKVAHHGSGSSSGAAFLGAARPGLAVAMLGAGNRFGFPSDAVVSRFRAYGAVWLDSAADGEITVESDGQLERVSTCRARAPR